jgi:hypothetical protein
MIQAGYRLAEISSASLGLLEILAKIKQKIASNTHQAEYRQPHLASTKPLELRETQKPRSLNQGRLTISRHELFVMSHSIS